MTRYIPKIFAVLALGALLTLGSFRIGVALVHADTSAVLDAGPTSSSTAPAPAPAAAPADPLHDPLANPAADFDELVAARKLGWPVALLAGAIMFFAALGAAGKRWPSWSWLAWLNNGRVAVGMAGLTTVMTAAFNAIALGGNWMAAAIAAASAGFALMHPTPQPQRQSSQRGFASVRLLSMLAIVGLVGGFSLASCGARQQAATKQFLTCTENAAVADLTPTVKEIIASGVGNWQAQLDALGTAFGKDALLCAVQAAEQFFATKVGAGSGDGTDAAKRAAEYLLDNGVAVHP